MRASSQHQPCRTSEPQGSKRHLVCRTRSYLLDSTSVDRVGSQCSALTPLWRSLRSVLELIPVDSEHQRIRSTKQQEALTASESRGESGAVCQLPNGCKWRSWPLSPASPAPRRVMDSLRASLRLRIPRHSGAATRPLQHGLSGRAQLTRALIGFARHAGPDHGRGLPRPGSTRPCHMHNGSDVRDLMRIGCGRPDAACAPLGTSWPAARWWCW